MRSQQMPRQPAGTPRGFTITILAIAAWALVILAVEALRIMGGA